MSLFRARRLPVIAAVLAAMAFAGSGAAYAAPADQIRLDSTEVLVPTGSTTAGVAVALRNEGDDDVVLTNVKVEINATGLQGKATVADVRPTFGGKCDTKGLLTTCTYEKLTVSIISAYPAFLDLKSVSGAVPGAWGTFTVSVRADGLNLYAENKAYVAEGVNLIAGSDISLSGDAGSTLSLTPSVRNAGSKVVRTVVLASSSGSRSASYRPQYKNCVYTDAQFFCVFDRDLDPGKDYTPASPIAVQLSKDAPAPSNFETAAEWMTEADAGSTVNAIRSGGGKNGTGPELQLVEKPSAALRGAPQTDTSAIDNFTHIEVDVTGTNPPDLTALGTTVRGKAGATVTAKIAIKNLGPAVIDSLNEFPSAYVTLPAGTTVVEADRNCVPTEGKTGEYRCLSGGLAVGETATWELKVKIGPAGKGTIVARTEVAGTDKYGPDRNAANNTADFLVNPPAGAGTGAGSGGEGTGGEGTGGEGGGLPVTGVNATVAAGAGIALLLAGAIVVVVARRRRTRYVA